MLQKIGTGEQSPEVGRRKGNAVEALASKKWELLYTRQLRSPGSQRACQMSNTGQFDYRIKVLYHLV